MKGLRLQAVNLYALGLYDLAKKVLGKCLAHIDAHELDRTREMTRGDLGIWLCAVGQYDVGVKSLRTSLSRLTRLLGQGDSIVARAGEMLRQGEERQSHMREIVARATSSEHVANYPAPTAPILSSSEPADQ